MTTSQINWLLLANAALGNFLAGTTSRIFSVSLPTVANSLETTIVGISWAVIAYQISQISLSLIFGRIGDIYGRHTLFGLGLAVSSVASLLCGLSQNVTQLIVFRLFQGVGASMTQSQGRALAMESVPDKSSGRAQGYMTTAFHSGVLVGPSLGGLIIDYIHWRAIFFFLIPIALAGIALTLVNRMKGNAPKRPAASGARQSIDYSGALLLIAATTALIAVIDQRIMEAMAPALRAVLIGAFVLSFVGFLVRERSTASPILDLSLFRIRMFSLSSAALLLVGVAQVMIGFLLPFYLQEVLHLTPSFIGLLFISAPVFTVALSPLVGWAVDKVGPRLPATAGILFLVGAGFFGSFLRADSHWTAAVGVLALWGLATALFFTANHTAMIGSVPPRHRGVATGAIYVVFGLGSTLGVSLATLLITAAFRYYSGDAAATPTPAQPLIFVQAMNFSFLVGGCMALAAMFCSALRGKGPANFS
ncbi:MAG TPA: MFS transporter [Candidatus Limnocylindria bacterium]|nr:MFS transporter [Candidatus Limnocylindria bacterium]